MGVQAIINLVFCTCFLMQAQNDLQWITCTPALFPLTQKYEGLCLLAENKKTFLAFEHMVQIPFSCFLTCASKTVRFLIALLSFSFFSFFFLFHPRRVNRTCAQTSKVPIDRGWMSVIHGWFFYWVFIEKNCCSEPSSTPTDVLTVSSTFLTLLYVLTLGKCQLPVDPKLVCLMPNW